MAVNIGALEGTISLRDMFSGKLKQAEGNLGDFAAKADRVGKKLTSTGQTLSIALTAPIAAAGIALGKLAADAVESESLFKVSFGSMAGAARTWSEDTAKALKLNQFELRRSAGVIYTMTEAMGLNQKQAFDMSTGVVKLAGDLESFFNLSAGEGFQKLQSGLVGETEPLRALGVVIDEATIKAKAYETGIAALGTELTAAQKVQARWAAILDQTSKAQGDLARTLDSPSNRLRALRNELVQTLTVLALQLLPVFEKMISALEFMASKVGTLAKFFGDLPPPIQSTIVVITGLAAAMGPLLIVTGQVMSGWSALALAAPNLALGITGIGAAIRTALLGPLGLALAAVIALATAFDKLSKSMQKDIDAMVAPGKKLLAAMDDVEESIKSGSKALVDSKVEEYTEKLLEAAKAEQELKKARDNANDTLQLVLANERSTEQAKEAAAKAAAKATKAYADAAAKTKVLDQATSDLMAASSDLADTLPQVEDAAAGVSGAINDSASAMISASSAYGNFLAEIRQTVDLQSIMQTMGLSIDDARLALEIFSEQQGGYSAVSDEFKDNLKGQIEFLRALEAEMERIANQNANPFGENVPQAEVFTSQGDFFDAMGATAQADAIKKKTEEAAKSAEEFKKIQEENLQLAYEQAEVWTDVGGVIADVFDDLGSGLGDLIYAIGEGATAWKKYAAAKAANDKDGMEAAAGDLWAIAGNYLGGALAGGGQTGFGGEQRGTYSQEGAEIGGYFGGIWGAVGAVLGGLISKAGDEARVSLEQFGTTVQAGVDFAEGGLNDAANQLASGFTAFMGNIQAQFGIAIQNAGGIQFDFTDRGLLEVSGDQIGTAGFRTLGEAAAYAAEQILALNAGTNNLGENMNALLESMGGEAKFDSLEELSAALNLAAEEDGQAMSKQASQIAEVTRQRERDMEIATKTGLSYEAVLAVADRRLAQIRAETEATRDSLFGVQNNISALQDIANAMLSFNAGIEAETNARLSAIASQQGYASALEATVGAARDAAAATREGSNTANPLNGGNDTAAYQVTDAMNGLTTSLWDMNNAALTAQEGIADTASAIVPEIAAAAAAGTDAAEAATSGGLAGVIDAVLGFVENVGNVMDGLSAGTGSLTQAMIEAGGAVGTMEGFLNEGLTNSLEAAVGEATGMAEAFGELHSARFIERQEVQHQIEDTERARDATDAMVNSMGDIPEAFDIQDIIDVWTKGANDAGMALLGMIRQVRGEEWGAAQERQLMTSSYRLQLAVQLQSVYQLLEATNLLSEATRGILLNLAREAEAILANPNLTVSRGGGGRGRDTGAEQRRQTRDRFFEDLARFEQQLAGVSSAVLDYQDAIAAIDHGIEEARKAGVAEDALARSRQIQVDLLQRDILAPFEEIASPGGPFSAIMDRYQDAISVLQEAAGATDDLAKSLFEIPEVLTEALAKEFGDQVKDSISDFAQSGDGFGLQSLISDLLAIDTSAMDPALASQVADMIAQMVADAARVAAAMDAVALQDGLSIEGVDTSAVNQFTDGLSNAENQLRSIQGAFASTLIQMEAVGASEEDLARLRMMHLDAIEAVRQSLMDSVQQYTDMAQGIGGFERKLIDLQDTFKNVADGLDAADAAEDSLKELYTPEEMRDSFIESANQIPEVFDDAMDQVVQSIQDHFPGLDKPVEIELELDKPATPPGLDKSLEQFISPLTDALSDTISPMEGFVDALDESIESMSGATDQQLLLNDAQQRATDQIAFDFLGTLDQLGIELPIDETLALAKAQFDLAKIEAINTALALQAAGALEDFDWDALINALMGAEFDPSTFMGGAGGGGGGGSYDPQQYADSVEGLFNAITDTISGWLAIGKGPLLTQALQMNADLATARQQMDDLLEMENSPRTRALRDQLEDAFKQMSQAWADEVLDSLSDVGTGLQSEFDDLIEHFADISAAFEELGILAENAEALAEAQKAALQSFWDNATSGIQGIIDRLTGVESGRAPADLLAEQQAVVQDLFERAMGGDLSALEELDVASEDFLDLINEVFGSGRAGGILRDQLLEMLQQVAGIDPADILDTGTGGGVFDPPGGGKGGILGGLIDEPYELRGSDLIAQPFDLAGYLSGNPALEFKQALKENRQEMEKAERDRERERVRREMQRMDVDTSQRGALIRATRGIGIRPINESTRVGV